MSATFRREAWFALKKNPVFPTACYSPLRHVRRPYFLIELIRSGKIISLSAPADDKTG
jgi:hypothetical protein